MLSMPSFDFHLPPCTEGFLIHLSPTMAIATLAIATVSLGGTISLCTSSVKDMEIQLKDLKRESKKIGLKIHKVKT